MNEKYTRIILVKMVLDAQKVSELAEKFANSLSDLLNAHNDPDVDVVRAEMLRRYMLCSARLSTLNEKIDSIQLTPGPQGLQGEQGIRGEEGLQGVEGVQGVQGEKGLQGVQGEEGLQGVQGEQGDKGEDLEMSEVVDTIMNVLDESVKLLKDGLRESSVTLDDTLGAVTDDSTSLNEMAELITNDADKGDDKDELGSAAGDGLVTINEMIDHVEGISDNDETRVFFNRLDTNGDGVVTKEEIVSFIGSGVSE
jgi:hypothetical protein